MVGLNTARRLFFGRDWGRGWGGEGRAGIEGGQEDQEQESGAFKSENRF